MKEKRLHVVAVFIYNVKMKINKFWIFAIFLLVISIFGVIDVSSYAGYDDLVVMGVGCAVGGFWNPIVGGGQCSVWQPRDIGDCSVCNSNPLQDCSEYQCRAIGENCRFVSGQCVDIDEDDTRSPRITNCQKISRYEEYQQGRRQPIYGEDKCEFGEVVKGKGVVAALTTDEFAKCRFDVDQNVEYADMTGIFDIFDEYSTNHYLVINPGEEATQEVIQECEDGGCRMFVKCADTANNEMRVVYPFIFEVKGAGEDITPPRIEFGSVDDGFVMKKGDHALDFGMLVSDESGVSECRYSRGGDLEFDQMSIMNCRGTYPTACGATLNNIQDEIDNLFYFKCKDTKNNINNIGHRLTIVGGRDLLLTISSPTSGGNAMRSNGIVVETREGAENGFAQCFYSWKTRPQFIFSNKEVFDTTLGTTHRQVLDFLEIPNGVNSVNYDVKVECEDVAGNKVEGVVGFELRSGDLTITKAADVSITNFNDVSFSISTSGGYSGDGKSRCGLFKDNGEHTYGSSGMIALNTVDNLIHTFTEENAVNGVHDWKVVCQDINGRSGGSLPVQVSINTPALNLGINPVSGRLNNLRADVVVTTSNGIDNGNAKCKVLAAGDDFVIDQNYDNYGSGLLEDSSFTARRTFSLPAGSGTRFVNGDNKYYFVCKDNAGKTGGQLITYTIDINEFDLSVDVSVIETNTQNPLLTITTTNGLRGDGYAECRLDQCNGINPSNIGVMSDPVLGSSEYTQSLRFRNLENGQYSCNIVCSDDVNDENRRFSVDIPSSEFTVNTPELRLNLVSPLDGQEYDKDGLQLIIETFGGVRSGELNAGDANCYYTDHLVDGFRVGDIVDITKKIGISLRDWAELVCGSGSCKRDIGSGFRHTKSISGNVNIGVNTLYVQCKDSAGRLAPDDVPMRVDFEVR